MTQSLSEFEGEHPGVYDATYDTNIENLPADEAGVLMFRDYVDRKIAKRGKKSSRRQRIYDAIDPYVEPFRPPPSQRYIYTRGDLTHYWSFWSIGACCAGCMVGFGSFWRRRSYRRWVLKQPKDKQLEILKKNTMTTMREGGGAAGKKSKNGNISDIESSKYIQSRFSTLPNAIDTRAVLSYSGDLRPSQWFEMGPLKFLNQRSNYPWASEFIMEICKWALRIGSITALTLGFESIGVYFLQYELGTNLYVRGICGGLTGFLVSRLASQGRLYLYQSLYMGISFGVAMAVFTYFNPDWAEKAQNNHTVITMTFPYLGKAFDRREESEKNMQQLRLKWLKDNGEAIRRRIREDPNCIGDLSFEERMIAQMDWRDAAKLLNIELDDEIDEMPYEQRKQLHIKASGDEYNINYDSFPAKYFRREIPQYFVLDAQNVKHSSDTNAEIEEAKQSMIPNMSFDNISSSSTNASMNNDVSPILVT